MIEIYPSKYHQISQNINSMTKVNFEVSQSTGLIIEVLIKDYSRAKIRDWQRIAWFIKNQSMKEMMKNYDI